MRTADEMRVRLEILKEIATWKNLTEEQRHRVDSGIKTLSWVLEEEAS